MILASTLLALAPMTAAQAASADTIYSYPFGPFPAPSVDDVTSPYDTPSFRRFVEMCEAFGLICAVPGAGDRADLLPEADPAIEPELLPAPAPEDLAEIEERLEAFMDAWDEHATLIPPAPVPHIHRNPFQLFGWSAPAVPSQPFFAPRPWHHVPHTELTPFGHRPFPMPTVPRIEIPDHFNMPHTLLPRGLNLTYDQWGGEKASGVLLHTKFLNTFSDKAEEELTRKQHYSGSVEYKAYAEKIQKDPDLWCNWSEKYINWRQLEILGLMSKGNWA